VPGSNQQLLADVLNPLHPARQFFNWGLSLLRNPRIRQLGRGLAGFAFEIRTESDIKLTSAGINLKMRFPDIALLNTLNDVGSSLIPRNLPRKQYTPPA